MSYITALTRPFSDYIIHTTYEELEKLGYTIGVTNKEVPEKIVQLLEQYEGTWYGGGPAPNSLSTIRKLNASQKLAVIGNLSDDSIGDFARTAYQKDDIEFRHMLTHPNQMSPISVIFVTEDGERTIAFNRGVSEHISTAQIDAYKDILINTEYLFSNSLKSDEQFKIHTYTMSLCPDTTKVVATFQGLKPGGDENSDLIKNTLSQASIIFMNEIEATTFINDAGYDDLNMASKRLPEILFIQTEGPKGAHIYQDGQYTHVGAKYVERVIDTTGAGDAFAGGFIYGLTQGKSLKNCAEIGAECGALVVQREGARIN